MSASKLLRDWKDKQNLSQSATQPTAQVTDPQLGGKPPEDEEIVEVPELSGMFSTHTLQAMVLILSNGDEVGIYHAWIERRPTFVETLGITFRFANDDGMHEVLITGYGTPASIEGLRKINRKLSWGKLALLRTGSNVVKEIRIEQVREEGDE